eukprot:TRINITY_DN478_c0_g1_i1.p5 TRINITY_DN478_c0_g1~~TRINITY_DN478_c0_g1_i1.p5  ORF type:complete len:105 (+),score=3.96 TRINITY_DN478_c0_g1_i1:928-1242(+)
MVWWVRLQGLWLRHQVPCRLPCLWLRAMSSMTPRHAAMKVGTSYPPRWRRRVCEDTDSQNPRQQAALASAGFGATTAPHRSGSGLQSGFSASGVYRNRPDAPES